MRYFHSQVCCIRLDNGTHQLLPYIALFSTDHRRENSKLGCRVVKEYCKRVKEEEQSNGMYGKIGAVEKCNSTLLYWLEKVGGKL